MGKKHLIACSRSCNEGDTNKEVCLFALAFYFLCCLSKVVPVSVSIITMGAF
jgi:hypothetical protein